MPKVLLSGRVGGEKDPSREPRAKLLYLLFSAGWDISNSNGDQPVTLSNIQDQIICSDAFVFTPGATLEELFKAVSIFVGYQTMDEKLNDKGTVVLNGDHSWDPFFNVLNHLRSLGTIKQDFRNFLLAVNEPENVIEVLDRVEELGIPDPERHSVNEGQTDEIYSYESPPLKGQLGDVCVFCSASIKDQSYLDDGYKFGQQMANSGYGCVSGAGRTGVMGAVVRGAVDAEGWTGGSNVSHIINLEGIPDGLSSFWLRPDIYTRMEVMIERSEAFVIFPGGAGTVQELLALLLLKESNDPLMRGKPIILFDRIDGSGVHFWDPLIKLLANTQCSSFFQTVNELDKIMPVVHEELISSKKLDS